MRRRWLLGVALVIAAAAIVSLSMLSQKTLGDLNYSGRTLSALSEVNSHDPTVELSGLLTAARAARYTDAYLESDSAQRLPRVSEPVRRAWAAQRVQARIIQLRFAGRLPGRERVLGLSEVVRDHSELAAVVGDGRWVARETDLAKLLGELRAIATSETAQGDRALAAAWAER